MEINCKKIKRKSFSLDWNQLLSDFSDEDRQPELVVESNHQLTENEIIDSELATKSDREISQSIVGFNKTLQTCGDRLVDKGEKVKINLRRHERELERRKNIQSKKADRKCEETIQLSDHSDDGASHVKKKSLSMFADSFCKKMEEDKNSRTVDAFEKELSYMNPCQARKLKKSQVLGMARSRTRISSSRSLKTSLVDSKKQIISNDDDDDDFTTSFSGPKSPQHTPSRNLRPRSVRSYHLVDEEPSMPKFMENLDPCMKDVKVYYPFRDDPDAVEVNYADMTCLAPEACISSSIMNFYIRFLQQRSSSSESAKCNYHVFNTYFYNKLAKLSYKEDSFLKLRKWWKGVNIFEKAYVLLPVHESAHWSLVIICLPNEDDELGPILLHLDSLGLHNSMSLFDNIKRFLKEEWSYLRKSESLVNLTIPNEILEDLERNVDQRSVLVPQQKNDYDCGLFVLFYMERFIKEAPEWFKKKDVSMFSRQWFRPREASNLRGKIYDLLVEEFKKAKENESTSSPKC
ncbi:hypothetical protein QVD17_18316 [Tagetes erecta]|uniref:Ubiquitin-like protease family profile domain-containing protein n=1 Tax=Tagetes erecta TaxID=13708 RepID=A0AAD8KK90_TARER|nr:hypothetical protein QVD17_18316 [Tagetes erecta]